MTQILDCLVNYFGLDENERPACRRYFSYHVLAGPGRGCRDRSDAEAFTLTATVAKGREDADPAGLARQVSESAGL